VRFFYILKKEKQYSSDILMILCMQYILPASHEGFKSLRYFLLLSWFFYTPIYLIQ